MKFVLKSLMFISWWLNLVFGYPEEQTVPPSRRD